MCLVRVVGQRVNIGWGKSVNVKRRFGSAIVACLMAAFFGPAPAHAAPKWIQLRSANFLLEGDADERDIRDVARRLEEFRETLSRLLTNARFDRTPTIIVVFGNDRSYAPVKPTFQGKPVDSPAFFQPGPDAHYVAMVVGRADPLAMVFHEFTHQFVRANLGIVPLWFEEGLAEYYSSFSADGKRAYVGKVIEPFVLMLRDRWVPLVQVLTTVHASPLYNNDANRDVFYAESWAFVHCLLNGPGSDARRVQLFRFLYRLGTGMALEQASMEAFGASIAGMEKELRQYVRQMSFTSGIVTFDQPIEQRVNTKAQPLGEAAAEARVGDLLMHMSRYDEAEKRLQNALRLDPKQVLACVSLGQMRIRQEKRPEGLEYLARAMTVDPDSFEAHLAYGEAIMRGGSGTPPPDTIETARKAYARALEIRPDAPEAMGGLGWTLLLTGQRLDEAQRLAERAMAADPGEPDYAMLLAQLLAKHGDFAGARKLLGPWLASPRVDARERARTVMAWIASLESK